MSLIRYNVPHTMMSYYQQRNTWRARKSFSFSFVSHRRSMKRGLNAMPFFYACSLSLSFILSNEWRHTKVIDFDNIIIAYISIHHPHPHKKKLFLLFLSLLFTEKKSLKNIFSPSFIFLALEILENFTLVLLLLITIITTSFLKPRLFCVHSYLYLKFFVFLYLFIGFSSSFPNIYHIHTEK